MGNSQKICTPNAKITKDMQNIAININIKGAFTWDNINQKNFVIWASYTKDEKIQNILNCIQKKYYPINIKVGEIYEESFTGEVDSDEMMTDIKNKSLTDYKKNDIINKGLDVGVEVKREHKVHGLEITCKFMIDLKSNNPLKCPIYFGMKEKYEWNDKNLAHLNAWNHFEDEFSSKPKCKYFDKCKAYIRLENGNNKINDLCHIKIFRHPPRNRNIKLSNNIYSLILNKNKKQNHPRYEPTDDDG
eukprot:268583_1